MIKVYANLIVAGRRVFSSILDKDKEAVKAELQARVEAGKLTQEKYEELIAL